MSAAFAASQQCGGITSPMKYRRSTSFPGKVQGQNALHHGGGNGGGGGGSSGNIVDMGGQGQNNLSHGPIDMNAMDDAREQFMQYQVSFMQSHRLDSYLFYFLLFHSFDSFILFAILGVCVRVYSFPLAFFSQ